MLSRAVVRRDGAFYGLSVLALLVALFSGEVALGRMEAVVLLLGYGLYVLWIARDTRRARRVE